ncbi:MAG: bifunctional diaminohydroxyphosphoribosylaminopyrimidine deaminase/5-amino-6-(5-phosphoribosylamino)uracil reductase RibD [Candidatus Saelkia tenebricola]|nr:bifunctional diaminohydroxyphosphoribosylaminopyrimidine deaminase/5-amino-6-(5-phosphoribosylamino)uracil reductase RibD [Candidatus Saelkia tenebricola]
MKNYSDSYFMGECLKLAEKGRGKTLPNPMVGAVLVKNGKIVSWGFHKKSGLPHAEVVAINRVQGNLKEAALYVNLEPCSSHGKTPPCVEKILHAGIKRVVIATRDPNPLHNGRGIKILKQKGIKVKEGVLKKEAQYLNRVFFKHIVDKMPYVSVKVAQSLDGRMADFKGESKWISSKDARLYAHQELRSKVSAIIVGINTVLKDNPYLTARNKNGELFKTQPQIVVLDTRLRIPLTANIIKKGAGRTIVAVDKNLIKDKKRELVKKKGVRVFNISSCDGKINLKELLKKLYREGIYHVLVEGGGRVIESFINDKFIDEMYVFMNNAILGGDYSVYNGKGFKISSAPRLKNTEYKVFKDTILIKGELDYV